MNYPNLERLIEIIDILRSENGCKWDREQTHATLRRNMLEEAYEAVDAIDDNDMKHLNEELGDVLWYIAEACDCFGFSLEEVEKGNIEKLAKNPLTRKIALDIISQCEFP